jgi:hypothetical protein
MHSQIIAQTPIALASNKQHCRHLKIVAQKIIPCVTCGSKVICEHRGQRFKCQDCPKKSMCIHLTKELNCRKCHCIICLLLKRLNDSKCKLVDLKSQIEKLNVDGIEGSHEKQEEHYQDIEISEIESEEDGIMQLLDLECDIEGIMELSEIESENEDFMQLSDEEDELEVSEVVMENQDTLLDTENELSDEEQLEIDTAFQPFKPEMATSSQLAIDTREKERDCQELLDIKKALSSLKNTFFGNFEILENRLEVAINKTEIRRQVLSDIYAASSQ